MTLHALQLWLLPSTFSLTRSRLLLLLLLFFHSLSSISKCWTEIALKIILPWRNQITKTVSFNWNARHIYHIFIFILCCLNLFTYIFSFPFFLLCVIIVIVVCWIIQFFHSTISICSSRNCKFLIKFLVVSRFFVASLFDLHARMAKENVIELLLALSPWRLNGLSISTALLVFLGIWKGSAKCKKKTSLGSLQRSLH